LAEVSQAQSNLLSLYDSIFCRDLHSGFYRMHGEASAIGRRKEYVSQQLL
jgi:hypothetical protein